MKKTVHTGPIKLPKRPDPKLWVSKAPFGLGRIKPHHIRDTLKVAWDNRDNLPYAYRILTQGVCDGCALGVSGLYDQTLDGPHICTTRLNVLRLSTMPAIKAASLHSDIDELRKLGSTQLRKLGRLPYPLIRSKGERSFRRLSWEGALGRIAAKARAIDPKQLAFYLTARGITNESYYVAAKAARLIGTNNIDNASRICHSPSKTAMKRSLGASASTCNYKDWIGTDVIVFWGSVAANNQPVSTKYMYAAKRKGTKIIVINPYREPAMEGYWIPSIPESALFGTKLADDFYQVNIGGDIAFMHGVMKVWFEMEEEQPGSAVDHAFISGHVNGYEELKAHVLRQSWELLEKSSGLNRERIRAFAALLAAAKSGVFVWSMGLTQHRFGTDNISQVANLALLRGFLGREHCGLMPIRGHSGVQGSGEMGADPFSLPGGGTSTSTERMVYFSPTIEGPRIEEARAEWQIYAELAARIRPELKAAILFKDADEVRREIALAAPHYEGIQRLKEQGDVFQWGGAWLCEDGICPTVDGKGNLLPVELPELRIPEGHFYATTRRGKQFNSMIYGEKDAFNAAERYDVLLNGEDLAGLAIAEGEAIVVYNRSGTFHGKAKRENIAKGNIELYWPEGNSLFAKGVYEPLAGIPEYNASVIVERADTYHAFKDTKYKEKRIVELEIEPPA